MRRFARDPPVSDPASLSLTRAHVSLDALRHNARVLTRLAAPARLMAVVKADAYGHGAVPTARALAGMGVDAFAVATVPEAIALRQAGQEGRILVFAPPREETLPAYMNYTLDASVSSLEAAGVVAVSGLPLPVHLKVDTGMHRLGIAPEDVAEALRLLGPPLSLAALWTHYAMADAATDTFTAEQVARFQAARALAPDVPVHVSNSYSLLSGQGMMPGAAWVRCGVSLYGLMEEGNRQHGLQEAMQFTSRIVASRRVERGEGVSYGLTWRAPEPTWVATVGAGYADGVRRGLSNRGQVAVAGQRYPIVGNVCMDYFMIAAGPATAPSPVAVGDEVVLFGPGGPSATEVAAWLDTISYEIACGVSRRVPRVYG